MKVRSAIGATLTWVALANGFTIVEGSQLAPSRQKFFVPFWYKSPKLLA